MSLEINGEVIDDDLINEELEHALKNYEHIPSSEDKETLLNTVKENIVYKTLLRQEADKLKITIPPEHINREYQLFFSQKQTLNHIESEKKLKSYIENKLKESKLIEQICSDLLPPQESHLRLFFEDNREHYFVAKQFHYWECGFGYTQPSLHPQLHKLLSYLIENLSSQKNFFIHTEKTVSIPIKNIEEILSTYNQSDWMNLKKYFFLKEWKTNQTKLTKEGLIFLENLEQKTISTITDYSGNSLLFTPVKTEEIPPDFSSSLSSQPQFLGIFIFGESRHNFVPTYEEVSEQVSSDLLEEMRQIKVKTYLRKVMDKSTIRDISYI